MVQVNYGIQGYPLWSATLLACALLTTAGCTKDSGSSSPTKVPALSQEVTKDNYLSGSQFCQTYGSITGKEFGKLVKVPKDYSHPEMGSLELYAYTLRAFDPAQASYIYVDGGPGQNTHGMMPEYLSGQMNELRFDQRGLGCSAPATWEEYKDASLYSSANNIRDMEEIRKAYGIKQWSVYGVSYGTVPATMYGHSYPTHSTSTVLEGVVGGVDYSGSKRQIFQTEQFNKVFNSLNLNQKKAFTHLLEDQASVEVIIFLFKEIVLYEDDGVQLTIKIMKKIINEDGSVNQAVVDKLKGVVNDQEGAKPHPQAPGLVDSNILNIIYCKNLGAMKSGSLTLSYDEAQGFYLAPDKDSDSVADCAKAGVTPKDVDNYEPANFSIVKPVYYFQGQEDGATLEPGAFHHFQTVPQKEGYFLLAMRGGHNPNLSRLEASGTEKENLEAAAEAHLFHLAVTGRPISNTEISAENSEVAKDQIWSLSIKGN